MLNPRAVPLKGEPDFTRFSDENLEACLEHVQGLIHAYSASSEEREALYGIWKALSDHQVDRAAFGMKGGGPVKVHVDLKAKPYKAFVAKPKRLVVR